MLTIIIAPVMFLLMLISYLDRGYAASSATAMNPADQPFRNIGFAATQGMTEDINLGGSDLNVSLPCQRARYSC